MKKFVTSSVVVGSFLLYSFIYNKNKPVTLPPVSSKDSQQPTSSLISPTSSGIPVSQENSPTPEISNPQQFSVYKDGEYTGSAEDAFYGNIQVSIVISGGKLTDVIFLQYPNDRHRSIEINTIAMPILKQEAITSQNAQVDIVSGATDSSQAFIQSLSSALSQAK